MTKLRSDSIFCKLTPEQVELLEDWLFEDKLGYKEVLEKIEKEFGVKGSQSGLSRFYQRLALERSREGLVEMVGACIEATGVAQPSGALQSGLLTLAYKSAVQLLVESPGKVREFTALLRALTSAQGQEIKRVEFEREGERIRVARLRHAQEEARKEEMEREKKRKWQEEEEFLKGLREKERLAKLAAKAARAVKTESGMEPRPDEKDATFAQPSSLPQVREGEGDGLRGEARPSDAALKPVEGGLEPVMLSREQREYADNGTSKEPVKPLNAA